MQLQRWRTVNRRYFAPRSGPSENEWKEMIRKGVVNGRIMGDMTYIDEDQIAAHVELPMGNSSENIPDLLS
ncbi:hypothetical protein [Marinobacterium stanieri]|uniref:Uncharacterized protein n=1 Tax=Marinobacterium stanieri TaxID=49186 RepID=A0A1N6Q4H4_9GAMM|nr:hypothetical protein [Marinobacterium stanieri]SIQ11491.1 hypothetical protein SAMN05421647_102251 [Marinobacterium stanieri]